jgi:hypothetical protein
MSLEELFNQFLREKTYLQGISKKTAQWYLWAYKAYTKFCGKIDKASLKEFVIMKGADFGRLDLLIQGPTRDKIITRFDVPAFAQKVY